MNTLAGLDSELRTVMEEVLLGLLGDEDDLPTFPKLPESAGGLACSVRIRGGWNGQVIVHASLSLASLAALRMFGDDARITRSGSDAQDALREIANIVAGNLKPLFGEHNTLGLPENLPGDITYPALPQVATATVHHGAGRLEVRVFEML
jgi:CheY-specific phosphatase CheX